MRASAGERQAGWGGRGWLVAVVLLWWALRWWTWLALQRTTTGLNSAPGSLGDVWIADPSASWQPWGGGVLDGVVVLVLARIGRETRSRRTVLVVVAIAAAARVFDAFHASVLSAHFDAVSLWHLQPRAWRAGLESGAPLVLGGIAGAAWFSVRALRRSWAVRDRAQAAGPHSMLPLDSAEMARARPMAWIAVSAAAVAWSWWSPLHARHGAVMPGVRLVSSVCSLVIGPSPRSPVLDSAAAGRLIRAGLLPPHVALDSEMPLRASTDAKADSADGATQQRPRPTVVVWVLLESTNRAWSALASRPLGATATARGGGLSSADPSPPVPTPGLLRLAALGTEYIGVHTAATPTHAALVAALCGVPPASWPVDAALAGESPLRDCLPGRLASLGYESIFLQGSNLSYTGLDAMSASMGFAVSLGADDALADAAAPRSAWGWHDREVYAAGLARIRAAVQTRRPVFLVIATSDAHWPGFADPRCEDPLPTAWEQRLAPDSRRMAKALVCADRELATFVDELEALGLGNDRLLLVTADHAAPDVAGVRALMPVQSGGAFAELPLIVVGPAHTPGAVVRVATSHLDLAPSTLDWLHAPDAGGWIGQPMQRRIAAGDGQLQVGLAGRRAVGLRLGELRWEGAPGELQAACAVGRTHPFAERVGLQPCDLASWIAWIDALWRDNRLAPGDGRGTVRPARSVEVPPTSPLGRPSAP